MMYHKTFIYENHIEEDTLVLLWIINPTTNLSINEFSASRMKLLFLMETVTL